ncbi:CPN21 [Symbiodinium sp. CCMP2456]|nr:CPN21 [Symbiodinium sp. CCMP2456]
MDVFGVDVACAKISGEVLELSLDSDSLVRDLKRSIADMAASDEIQFHPICQKLMFQGRPLEDSERLRVLCEPPAERGTKAKLEMTLLLTVDSLLATFGLSKPDLAVAAIKVARTMVACDEQVLSALYHCTRWGLFRGWLVRSETTSQCRVEAAKAISSFAQSGQENAVDALIRCLKSPSRQIRDLVIDGLLMVPIEKGQLRKKLRLAIDGLLQHVQPIEGDDYYEDFHRIEKWQVLPAVEILGRLSPPGDEDALAVLKKALDLKYDLTDRRILARRVVLSSLGHVGWDCPQTARKLVQLFVKLCSVLMVPLQIGRFGMVNDPHDHWETTVPAVAQQMCSFEETRLKLPESVVDELVSLLSHAGQTDPRFRFKIGGSRFATRGRMPNPASIRRAAIELLSACANESVVEKTRPLLQHHWDEVKIAAITVLGRRSFNDEVVMAELTNLLHSEAPPVAQEAVTALGQVGKGNAQVIATLRSCLSHADGWVRRSAPKALLNAVGSDVVDELRQLSAQGDVEVAEASLLALPDDVRAAAAALEHQDPHVQFVAAKLLLKIHRVLDNSVAALCARLGENPKYEPEAHTVGKAPSAETFAAVKKVVMRREISETKRICIGFLYDLGVQLQHQEAINLLQELLDEKLWHPVEQAQDALRLLREKPKPKLRKMIKAKWVSSMLSLDRDDDLPVPSSLEEDSSTFWDAYSVDDFTAHINEHGVLETGSEQGTIGSCTRLKRSLMVSRCLPPVYSCELMPTMDFGVAATMETAQKERGKARLAVVAVLLSGLALRSLTFCGSPTVAGRQPGRGQAEPSRGSYICRQAVSLKVDGAVKPLGKFLLLKSAKAEEMTKAGLLLPKSEKPKEGEVVAVGPGEAIAESGVMVPMSVKVGEKVLYSKYGASETIECSGEDHVLVREDDVLLKYEGDEPSLEQVSMPRGKVLVKLLAKEEETSFGLLLSKEASKQTTTAGKVIAVGPGIVLANGDEQPSPVQVGDMVRFRYGDEVDLDIGDDQFSVVSSSNCIAKWQDA